MGSKMKIKAEKKKRPSSPREANKMRTTSLCIQQQQYCAFIYLRENAEVAQKSSCVLAWDDASTIHRLFEVKMPINDLNRILRGAGIVMEAARKRYSPELADQLARSQQQIAEFITAVYDVYQQQQQKHAYDPYKKYEGVTYDGTTSPSSTAAEVAAAAAKAEAERIKREKERDFIGFDAIVDEPQKDSANDPASSSSSQKASKIEVNANHKVMRERAIPSTQLSRFMGFGSLAVRMAMGAAMTRATVAFSNDPNQSITISEANAERLAEALCRMRGAALKLGQMLSMTDDTIIPPSLTKALDRVKHAADYMPKKQLEKQLAAQLGSDWKSKFSVFEETPIAAASIGQVHKATLLDGTEVAVKIQYPGVADSIDSDLQNLKTIVDLADFLPAGLFVDQIIQVASVELKDECESLF
jgi:aarF domain-containing kinase